MNLLYGIPFDSYEKLFEYFNLCNRTQRKFSGEKCAIQAQPWFTGEKIDLREAEEALLFWLSKRNDLPGEVEILIER